MTAVDTKVNLAASGPKSAGMTIPRGDFCGAGLVSAWADVGFRSAPASGNDFASTGIGFFEASTESFSGLASAPLLATGSGSPFFSGRPSSGSAAFFSGSSGMSGRVEQAHLRQQ